MPNPQQAINFALENAIVSYLNSQNTVSGSLLSGSNIAYFTGINNQDIELQPGQAGALIICHDANEIVFNSYNFEIYTYIETKEIAADTLNSSPNGGNGNNALGTIAGAIFNEFMNSNNICPLITSASLALTSSHVSVWQCKNMGMTEEIEGDAIINKAEYRFVGALTI